MSVEEDKVIFSIGYKDFLIPQKDAHTMLDILSKAESIKKKDPLELEPFVEDISIKFISYQLYAEAKLQKVLQPDN